MMASSNTLETFADGLKARSAQGQAPYATAYVADGSVEGVHVMKSFILQCYEDAGLLIKIFTQLDDAKEWLRLTLAAARSDP